MSEQTREALAGALTPAYRIERELTGGGIDADRFEREIRLLARLIDRDHVCRELDRLLRAGPES